MTGSRRGAIAVFCAAALAALALGWGVGRLALAQPEDNGAAVRIAWGALNFPATPRTFRVRPGAPVKTWDTRSVASLKDAPVGEELQGALYVTPAQDRQYVLVVENTGAAPLRFFAAPHQTAPPERSLGVGVHCLCVHIIYTVPPHKVWYRVMDLYVRPAETNGEVVLTHTLVGLPPRPPASR